MKDEEQVFSYKREIGECYEEGDVFIKIKSEADWLCRGRGNIESEIHYYICIFRPPFSSVIILAIDSVCTSQDILSFCLLLKALLSYILSL